MIITYNYQTFIYYNLNSTYFPKASSAGRRKEEATAKKKRINK